MIAMSISGILKKLFKRTKVKASRRSLESVAPIATDVDMNKPKNQLVKEAVIDLYHYGYTHCTSKMIYAYLEGCLTIGDISKCLYKLGQKGFINNTTRLSTIADTDRSSLYWTLANPKDYVQN